MSPRYAKEKYFLEHDAATTMLYSEECVCLCDVQYSLTATPSILLLSQYVQIWSHVTRCLLPFIQCSFYVIHGKFQTKPCSTMAFFIARLSKKYIFAQNDLYWHCKQILPPEFWNSAGPPKLALSYFSYISKHLLLSG